MDETTDKNIIRIGSHKKYDRRRCEHKEIIFDELMEEVLCAICGNRLNPVAMLARIYAEKRSFRLNLENIRNIAKSMKERRKTKCEFCHKMTRIS